MSHSDIVLGIDLGTSFSSAAAWVGGKIYLVPDARGEPCIPSVVHYPEQGKPVVGFEAEALRRSDPENTVSGIKRILGRAHDSNETRLFSAASAVRMSHASNGSVILKPRGVERTPIEVAGEIFKYLKALAETRFKSPVRSTVLTVPASCTAASKDATVRAARQAGLEVVATIPEPTAGAIAYQLDRFRGQRRLLVYDFGGGTFDVTIMEQHDSQIKPLAVGGDGMLGGDDLDLALAQMAAGSIWQKHRVDITKDVVRWEQLLQEAEITKRALSVRETAPLRLKNAFSRGGKHHDLDLVIHRKDVEPRWAELIDRSLKVTAQTMVSAGLRPAGIDTLLLVGGTTYVPVIKRTISKMMGKQGFNPGDPQTAVACGAAVVAARSMRAKKAA